ncbi:MAG TPA: hypothetical protein VGE08_18620 [Steroidobacter sp.]
MMKFGLMAFVPGGNRGICENLGCQQGMSRTRAIRVNRRHGMAQLADDQAGHQ